MEKSEFTHEMEEFGTKMYVLAILCIVSIFTGSMIQLVMFILLLISLKHIKEANLELEDVRLEKFRKNIIYAIIIGIVGGIVIIIIGVIVVWLLLQSIPGFPFSAPLTVSEFEQLAPTIRILLLVLLGGIPVGAIALGLVGMGWKHLESFFEKNSGLFPNQISRESIEGSGKIGKAYLLLLVSLLVGAVMVLIAFILFPQIEVLIKALIAETTPSLDLVILLVAVFAVPGIAMGILGLISFILMVLGYFELANLRKL